MQTWLALPDGKEEIDPAFEHVGGDGLPLVEGDGVSARVLMGSLWGQTASVTQHAATIYADILLDAGASVPIDADADERAVLLVEGEAQPRRRSRSSRSPSTILAPGAAMTPHRDRARRALMLLGGEAFATPRHVWWNFVSSSRDRIDQAKHDWQARRLPARPRRRARNSSPSPTCPKTVSYP